MKDARFGSLVVTDAVGPRGGTFVCRCDCGNVRSYPRSKVLRGQYVSCGCRKAAQQRVIATWTEKHGHAATGGHTRTYKIWQGMLNRCRNRNQKSWAAYGGRGISVCKEWEEFSVFLSDMGEAPPGLTLDRENNDGNYEKGNCRWATRTEQRRNSSRVVPVTVLGKTLNSWEWAELLGVSLRRVHKLTSQLRAGRITEVDFIRGGKRK